MAGPASARPPEPDAASPCPRCGSRLPALWAGCGRCGWRPRHWRGLRGGRARPVPLRVKVVALGVAVLLLGAFVALESRVLITAFRTGLADAGCGLPVTLAPQASYDEQLFLVEGGDMGNLTVGMGAVAQADANGYGPAYLLNGVTSAGYWYQVGLTYDWPCGAGYAAGFHYFSEVWSPDGRPVTGPTNLLLAVAPGDNVTLSLGFHGSGVAMTARDLTTGASESTDYSSAGASAFLGGLSVDPRHPGWFTGIMTEWYHVQAYYGGEEQVTYTALPPMAGFDGQGVTLGIDEQTVAGGVTFSQTHPVEVGCPCSFPFAYDGATEAVDPSSFQTGA